MAEYERIKEVEIKLGSTICFHVRDVNYHKTKWYFNGTKVSIKYDSQATYIKRKAADFSDSGFYKCKVDGKTISVFNVIVYDLYQCDLGSIIDLRVKTTSAYLEWTFNSKKVTSEGDPHIGFEKKNAALEDSGKYECIVDGKVKCAFFVLVYDFDVGMFPRESTGTDSLKITPESIKETHTHRNRLFAMHERKEYEVLEKFYEETNQEVSIYFNKEEKYDRGKSCYLYDVIHHEYYECAVGSRLHLRYRKGSVSPTWTFNAEDAQSECDPKEGFEKKKADIKDSGTYECRVNGRVMRIFDVIVYGTYEVKFGNIIHLEVDINPERPKWFLNDFYEISACDPHKGFKKGNADFTDSGKYKCRVGNKVTNVFQVIVYEYLFADEFIGIRISVPDEAVGKKPDFLSQQYQTCSYENISQQELETNQTGGQHEQVPTLDDPDTPNPSTDDPDKKVFQKGGQHEQVPTLGDPDTPDPSKGDPDTPDPSKGDPDTPDPSKDEKLKDDEDYKMNRNPRGLAVIISIGEFDDAEILNFFQMTRADAGFCVETFRHFNFLIRESLDNTRHGILHFLSAIANEDHSNCDCLVLYISSHGANGYFCCSDYSKIEKTGCITFNEMLSIFLSVPSLAEKPKLVFIDSCRDVQVDNLVNQVPIGIVKRDDLQRNYANILVGYAAIVGAAAEGDINGSFYTIKLTNCMMEFAATRSILDVMTAVIRRMREDHQIISECKFSLERRLVMSLPAPEQ